MKFMPKTKLGKWSFWITICSFILIYINYLASMALQNIGIELRLIFPGIILMASILVCGILSFISIVKYKDKSIALIITSIIGLLELLSVIAEFILPHS
jgi:hypothetical protein